MYYEFVCQDCKKKFDIKASLAEYEKGLSPLCPHCESEKTTQVLSNFFTVSNMKQGESGSSDFDGSNCSSCPMGGECPDNHIT